MSAELIASFQAITGLNDQTKCKKFINDAHGNLELALSNYFDSGAIPPEDLHPSVFQPPPPRQEDVMQIEEEEPEEVPEPLEVAPALYPSQAIDKPLPLQGISVKAQVLNFMANIELAQRFVNDGKNPIEAVFQFQQYDSALHGFDVEVDGKIYKGKIKSKQKALEEYDDTIASGHGAYLLEKDKSRDNVYRINVGNLPPGKEATLRIYYVTELDTEGDSMRLVLPATRTKVYSKSAAKEQQGEVSAALSGLNVHLDLEMNHDLVEITSPTHQIEVKLDGKKGTLDLKPNQEQRGRAMVVLIKLANPHAPMVTIEKYKSAQSTDANAEKKRSAVEIEREEKRVKQDAVTVSLFPKVEIQDDPVCEIIFLVDRSGSMAGSRMNQTKNALQIFLRSLPVGTKFNIVGFGDTYEKLFPSSVFFDDRSLNTATNHVLNMQSNLIGTNILPPLRDILTREADPEYPRQVFCLTDGEVKNTEEVLEFVKNNAHGCRVFTFGIGADASKALVLGIAKYGHGKAEFIRSGERIEPVVMRQLKRALQPVLRDVNINWGPLPVAERKTAYDIPPIFDGDKLVVSTFLDSTAQVNNANEQSPAKNEVTIKAKSGNESFEWRAEFDLQKTIDGELAHKLTAMKLIRDYEKNKAQNLKKEISDLGAVWGLVSSQTSYIAVEMRRDATEGNMEPMDVNEATKVYGAENSEQIQVEGVRRQRRMSPTLDRRSEVMVDQLHMAQPQLRQASAAKNKSGGGAGAFFGKIGSWFSGEKKAEEEDHSNKKGRSKRKSSNTVASSAPVSEDKYRYYRDDAVMMDAENDEDDASSGSAEELGGRASSFASADRSNFDAEFTSAPPTSGFGAAPIQSSAADSFSSFTFEPVKPVEMQENIDMLISEEPAARNQLVERESSSKLDKGSSSPRKSLKESPSSEKLKKLKKKDSEKVKEKEKKEKKDKQSDKDNLSRNSKKDLVSSSKVAKPSSVPAPGMPAPKAYSSESAPPPPPPSVQGPGYGGVPPTAPLSRSSSSSGMVQQQQQLPNRPQSNASTNAPSSPSTGGGAPPSPRRMGGMPTSPKQAISPGSSGRGGHSPSSSRLFSASSSVEAVVDPVIKQITSAQRPLDRIVLAQAANGSFVAEHIAAALGIDVTRVKQALPAFLAALETSLLLWATAIALSFLENREGNSRDEWDLIGGKAKKYLTRTLSATPQLVEQVLEEAKKFVATI